MPAVLIETGFINNDSDNALFDEKFDDIAEAIAYAILGTLDETKTEEPEHSSSVLYKLLHGGCQNLFPATSRQKDKLFQSCFS